MIEKINISNFKCFKNLELNLGALNLFSGQNGMGKSTVIQALLLLRQSHKHGYLQQKKVCLNGDYIQLGTGWDILHEYAEVDMNFGYETIQLNVMENSKSLPIKIKYAKDSDVLYTVVPYGIRGFSLFGSFEYLNAERTSPQTIYPRSSFHTETMQQLGIHGEFTVHYLSKYQDMSLSWDSCTGEEKTLKGAVQYWLNDISPNIKIELQDVDSTDLSKIGYYFADKEKSNTFRPTNIGFGVSYVLPVIVALLKAKRGSIVVIENPEAHLHPKGQRKMGELIAKCASTGVQIFIETHSDHVLNGIRIAVKKSIIKNTDVRLYFFSKSISRGGSESIVTEPKINESGKLDFWPEDFFDEWEKALDEII